jgi:hypothetical protein
MIGWWAATFGQEQKVDAVFKPPKDKKVLVFVDDVRYPVNYEPVKAQLTEQLNKRLKDNKVAGDAVSYDRLVDLMAVTPNFNQLHVPDVGKRLGADLVLYVEITTFLLRETEATPIWQGKLTASVKWVDATGRIWPKDRPEGFPVPPIELPMTENASAGYGAEVARELADKLADKIAKLFYDHTEPVK